MRFTVRGSVYLEEPQDPRARNDLCVPRPIPPDFGRQSKAKSAFPPASEQAPQHPHCYPSLSTQTVLLGAPQSHVAGQAAGTGPARAEA